MLEAWLEFHRTTLVPRRGDRRRGRKRRPVPLLLSLHGLLRHMAEGANWFRRCFWRKPETPFWADPVIDDVELIVDDADWPTSPPRIQCEVSRGAAGHDLDDTGSAGASRVLRWINPLIEVRPPQRPCRPAPRAGGRRRRLVTGARTDEARLGVGPNSCTTTRGADHGLEVADITMSLDGFVWTRPRAERGSDVSLMDR
jgi:hypothetical protein